MQFVRTLVESNWLADTIYIQPEFKEKNEEISNLSFHESKQSHREKKNLTRKILKGF